MAADPSIRALAHHGPVHGPRLPLHILRKLCAHLTSLLRQLQSGRPAILPKTASPSHDNFMFQWASFVHVFNRLHEQQQPQSLLMILIIMPERN